MALTAVVLAGGPPDELVAGAPGAPNKAFLDIAGVPLAARTLASLRASSRVGRIVAVAPPGDRSAAALTPTTSGTEPPSAARVGRFRERVLDWGAAHRRDLPWRATRDPWRVLVSEVMLQQTQVDRVIHYYTTFVSTFPQPAECARAGAGDVVRLWSGLGYNRRALNLHRAATIIADTHGGAVPADERSLRSLPGVGVYTARAVLSFAFEADVATVDTNVVRVLSRGMAGTGLTVAAAQYRSTRNQSGAGSAATTMASRSMLAATASARPRASIRSTTLRRGSTDSTDAPSAFGSCCHRTRSPQTRRNLRPTNPHRRVTGPACTKAPRP